MTQLQNGMQNRLEEQILFGSVLEQMYQLSLHNVGKFYEDCKTRLGLSRSRVDKWRIRAQIMASLREEFQRLPTYIYQIDACAKFENFASISLFWGFVLERMDASPKKYNSDTIEILVDEYNQKLWEEEHKHEMEIGKQKQCIVKIIGKKRPQKINHKNKKATNPPLFSHTKTSTKHQIEEIHNERWGTIHNEIVLEDNSDPSDAIPAAFFDPPLSPGIHESLHIAMKKNKPNHVILKIAQKFRSIEQYYELSHNSEEATKLIIESCNQLLSNLSPKKASIANYR